LPLGLADTFATSITRFIFRSISTRKNIVLRARYLIELALALNRRTFASLELPLRDIFIKTQKLLYCGIQERVNRSDWLMLMEASTGSDGKFDLWRR